MLHSTFVRGALAAVLALSAAGAVSAQGMIKTLKMDGGAMSATEGGVLRCSAGEEFQFALIGEDDSMQRVPMEHYGPKAKSSDDKVVRAAVPSGSDSQVIFRCMGEGEAWVTATTTAGVRAQYPVLVGKARKQPNVKAPAPTE